MIAIHCHGELGGENNAKVLLTPAQCDGAHATALSSMRPASCSGIHNSSERISTLFYLYEYGHHGMASFASDL